MSQNNQNQNQIPQSGSTYTSSFLDALDVTSKLYGVQDIDPEDGTLMVPEDGYVPLQPKDNAELMEFMMQWESPAYFAMRNLKGPPEPPYNGRALISEHQQEWSDIVTTHKRACFLASRDHGKSFFFSLALPIWTAWKNPSRSTVICTASEPGVKRVIGELRKEIEENPRLEHLLPKGKKQKWSETSIRLANGHTIYGLSAGSKVRGYHPILLICDDMLSETSVWSETERRRETDFFFYVLTPMPVPGAPLFVVGTPMHALDLYHDLSNNTQYLYKRYAAINDNGEALWPERYPLEALERKREEVQSNIRFAREYLCKPMSDAATLFPLQLFKGDKVEQYGLALGAGRDVYHKAGMEIYMGVDLALSAEIGADYSVIWTMAIDAHGNRWIVDIQRNKGMAFELQKSLIVDVARKYKPERIYIESNQAQRIFGDTLTRETDLPIKLFYTTGQNKNSLEKGIPSLRPLFENRKVRIPRGTDKSIQLTDIWMAEMGGFTVDKGKVKSVEAHDDLAMAFWICEQAVREGSQVSFSFTPEDGEEVPSEFDTNMNPESPNVVLIGFDDADEDDGDDYMDDYMSPSERLAQRATRTRYPWEY